MTDLIVREAMRRKTMSDDMLERLREDQLTESLNPKGCKSNHPNYPCAIDCPCAMRDRIIRESYLIKDLQAENAGK